MREDFDCIIEEINKVGEDKYKIKVTQTDWRFSDSLPYLTINELEHIYDRLEDFLYNLDMKKAQLIETLPTTDFKPENILKREENE